MSSCLRVLCVKPAALQVSALALMFITLGFIGQWGPGVPVVTSLCNRLEPLWLPGGRGRQEKSDVTGMEKEPQPSPSSSLPSRAGLAETLSRFILILSRGAELGLQAAWGA